MVFILHPNLKHQYTCEEWMYRFKGRVHTHTLLIPFQRCKNTEFEKIEKIKKYHRDFDSAYFLSNQIWKEWNQFSPS